MAVRALVLVATLVCAARDASANRVCVAIDPARDRLNPDEQQVVKQVFEAALLAAGESVTTACDETWALSHVRLGTSIHILLLTSRAGFTATAPAYESLGMVYEGLIWRVLAARGRSQPSNVPPHDETLAVDVTRPAAPPRATQRGAVYVRIGYGVAPAMTGENESRTGPTIGVGYRRTNDAWLFDMSIMNTHAWREPRWDDESSYELTVMSFGRIAAMRLLLEEAGSTWYGGGGLSFGQTAVRTAAEDPMFDTGATHHGYAMQIEALLGYEMMRDRAVRVFFEAWLSAPLSSVEVPEFNGVDYDVLEYWAPTLNFSTGIGF